jgi:hypothetical protein
MMGIWTWGDSKIGFQYFYNEGNLDYFGRIGTQRFHRFTRKIIGAFLGG